MRDKDRPIIHVYLAVFIAFPYIPRPVHEKINP